MIQRGAGEGEQDPIGTGPVGGPETDPVSVSLARPTVGYAPGRVLLGKYQIVRKLGVGGMAEVYQAEHLQLGSQVAIKLPLGRHATALGGARLLREAQVAASLNPERVARVYDIGILEEGTPFIVLEYLEGQTLAEILSERQKLPIQEAVHFIVEACVGLKEAHQRGIVHRDVKPSNLFIERRPDGSSKLKILDFGIASIRAAAVQNEEVTTLTDSSVSIGSPPYMAPEQARGTTAVDARCDVWALGVTLYQLVSGTLPFRGNATGLIASILSDDPPSLRRTGLEIPTALEQIIFRCMSKDRRERHASAAELCDALRPFESPAEPRAVVTKKHGWRIAVLGAAAASAAIALVAISTSSKRSVESAAAASDPGEVAPPRNPDEIAKTNGSPSGPIASSIAVASGGQPAMSTATPLTAGASTSTPASPRLDVAARPLPPPITEPAKPLPEAQPIPKTLPATSSEQLTGSTVPTARPRALLDERTF